MPRQLAEVPALILCAVGIFVLWMLPGKVGAVGAAAVVLGAIALYYYAQKALA